MKGRLIHLSFYLLLYAGCATITNPNGGPKDVKPPKLENSIPANKQTNFKGKTVELTFNELVKLNNAKDEIIITPSVGKEVEFKVKKNQVFITPKDGWQDSTTYSLLFREGVKDITEGNAPINLKLAFSTGPTIDSLSIIGKVTELLKGTPLDKMTVAIYKQDTFDIFTDVPSYFTKTDKRGRFSLDNIKNGNYKIYAFDDKNKNLKVESRTEKFGFLAKDIALQKNTDSLTLPLIMLDMRAPKILSIRNIGAITKLRFNKFVTTYKLAGDTTDVTFSYGDNQTEMTFWVSSEIGDSIKLQLTARDSLDNTVDSIFYVKQTKTKTIKDSFKWSLGQPMVDSESGKFETTISFNKPIVNLNFDSLYIKKDTTDIINFSKEDISLDLRRKQFILTKELDRKFFKAEIDPFFSLKAGKGFIQSIDNDTTRALASPVAINWPEDTGILIIDVITTEPNYLIQLMQEGKILRTIKNEKKYIFKNLPAATYGLRIVVDSNANGKWDPGNIRKNTEPERVIFYTGSDKKQTIPIRANWELGPLTVKF